MFYIQGLPDSFSQEQLFAYIEQYKKTGSLEARNVAVEHNIKLAIRIIRKYNLHTPYETEDLVSIGLIHLLKQLDKFDTSRGVKFSSWVTPVLIHQVGKYMSENNHYMHVERLDQTIDLALDQNEEPDVYTMEDFVQSEMQYYKNKSSDEEQPSLNPIMEYGLTLADTLPNETEDFIADYEEREIDQIAIHIFYDLLQELSERDQQIVILRFGFYGNAPHSYRKISKILGISFQYVQVIIEKLLRKVRLKLEEYHGIEIPNQKKK